MTDLLTKKIWPLITNVDVSVLFFSNFSLLWIYSNVCIHYFWSVMYRDLWLRCIPLRSVTAQLIWSWWTVYMCLFNTRSLNTHESQRANPGKTPIQILHEYGTRSGNLPVYVMEKAEGEAHQPSFVFSVKIGDVLCTGNVQSHLCFVDSCLSLDEAFCLSWKSYADNSERSIQRATYYLSLLLCCQLCLLLR